MTASRFALILVSVALNACAQIVLRRAMQTVGVLPPVSEPLAFAGVFLRNLYLWAGLFCYGFSILTWLAVLSNTQVSVAYPMLSIGYIIAAVLGYYFLGESVGVVRIGGIVLICLGVLLIARSS